MGRLEGDSGAGFQSHSSKSWCVLHTVNCLYCISLTTCGKNNKLRSTELIPELVTGLIDVLGKYSQQQSL